MMLNAATPQHENHPPLISVLGRLDAGADRRVAPLMGAGDAQHAHHLRAVQRLLHHGRAAVPRRGQARRLCAPCRGHQGGAREGRQRGPPRDRGARRRHALSLGHVGARPRRAYRRAHQHDRARHLRAGQPRVRFRQGGISRADGRGEVSALCGEPARCERRDAARIQGPRDLRFQRRAHRAHGSGVRAVAARVVAGGFAFRLDHRHHEAAGGRVARRRRGFRVRGAPLQSRRRDQAAIRAPRRASAHRSLPRSVRQFRRQPARWSNRASTRIT